MGLRGTYISVGGFAPGLRRALGVDYTVVELVQIGRQLPTSTTPPVTAEAAVLFTSGATGPAKGVVYRHAQLEAQRDLVRDAFGIRPSDRLVAAFAPFALYGPALGIASVVPAHGRHASPAPSPRARSRTRSPPSTPRWSSPRPPRCATSSTASALDAAQRARCARVRLLLSAGAPVPRETLRAASDLLGGCEAHTPYGMTEALPVADVTLAELEVGRTRQRGLVGHPVTGVQVSVSPLDAIGAATGAADRRRRMSPARSASAPRTSRTTTTSCGRPSATARATPGGTAPATSGTSTPRVGSGSRAGSRTSSRPPPAS